MMISSLVLAGALLTGCPLAHDDYDTGRACETDRNCPADELCARPDAAVGSRDGGGPAEALCYSRQSVVPCFVDDAGVAAYYCFSTDQHCVYEPRVCLQWADAGCGQDAGCDGGGLSVDAGCVRWRPERFGCEPGGGAAQ